MTNPLTRAAWEVHANEGDVFAPDAFADNIGKPIRLYCGRGSECARAVLLGADVEKDGKLVTFLLDVPTKVASASHSLPLALSVGRPGRRPGGTLESLCPHDPLEMSVSFPAPSVPPGRPDGTDGRDPCPSGRPDGTDTRTSGRPDGGRPPRVRPDVRDADGTTGQDDQGTAGTEGTGQ